MLPHVQRQNRRHRLQRHHVVVPGGGNVDAFVPLRHQPDPAGPDEPLRRLGQQLQERIDGAVGGDDGLRQPVEGRLSGGAGDAVKVQLVVVDHTGGVFQPVELGGRQADVPGDQLGEAQGGEAVVHHQVIEGVDAVGIVVVVVVVQRVRVTVGHKRDVAVGEWGRLKGEVWSHVKPPVRVVSQYMGRR